MDQTQAWPVAALGEIDRLLSEKVTGGTTQGPKLQETLAYIREGDTVRVKCLIVSRSTTDLLPRSSCS